MLRIGVYCQGQFSTSLVTPAGLQERDQATAIAPWQPEQCETYNTLAPLEYLRCHLREIYLFGRQLKTYIFWLVGTLV